ncbi:MAG: helicase C-terminal domain-containing protein [Chthoniobacterales bacterium]
MISLREDTGEDISLLSFEEEIAEIFSPTGLLSKASNFEWRKEQQDMARQVARTLYKGDHLVVEAGTGVGKSLAYLIPSVLHAVRHGKKAILSTHTINLQEQLIYKDIPMVQKLLPVEFEATLLKGRQNYLCPQRLERALQNASDLFTTEERKELERIQAWSETTTEGSLSDFTLEPDPQVWLQVCSERHICTQRTCGKSPKCFYQRAKKRIQSAQVVVLNHPLFFTLLGDDSAEEGSGEGYLFPNDFVIFDEAHTLEAVASQHIGLSVSQYGLRQALNRLYNPKTKKGIFRMLGKELAITATTAALDHTDEFFSELGKASRFEKGREFRVRDTGIVDAAELTGSLTQLIETLLITVQKMEEDNTTKSELRDMAARLNEGREGISDFLSQKLDAHVYWVEKTGKTGAYHSVNAAPVDLSQCLKNLLFRPGTCSVMTSATLSVGKSDLSYFRDRVGARDIPAVQIGSPFDYERQMKLHVVRKMPDPRDPTYEEALEKYIAHYTTLSEARAFVLFTSYRAMSAVAARMEEFYSEKGWTLLVQGAGKSRTRMLEEFRDGGPCVLFGTDSFWSGVDVPGEALSNVIITRLPFAQPDHPLIEAKLEHLEAMGQDPFQGYSLPEAILKLRQGVGRLIRTKQDHGMVVILDSRVITKPYGKAFLSALPRCPVEIVS